MKTVLSMIALIALIPAAQAETYSPPDLDTFSEASTAALPDCPGCRKMMASRGVGQLTEYQVANYVVPSLLGGNKAVPPTGSDTTAMLDEKPTNAIPEALASRTETP